MIYKPGKSWCRRAAGVVLSLGAVAVCVGGTALVSTPSAHADTLEISSHENRSDWPFNPERAPRAAVGQSYNYGLLDNDTHTGVNASLASGALPPGLTLDSGTGVISGRPDATGLGDWDMTFDVDVDGVSWVTALRITVTPNTCGADPQNWAGRTWRSDFTTMTTATVTSSVADDFKINLNVQYNTALGGPWDASPDTAVIMGSDGSISWHSGNPPFYKNLGIISNVSCWVDGSIGHFDLTVSTFPNDRLSYDMYPG